MIFFRLLIAATAILLGIYGYFYIRRVMKFYGWDITRTFLHPAAVIFALLLALGCIDMKRTRSMIILHFVVLSIILDIIALLVKFIFRNRQPEKGVRICRMLYGCGLLPVVITGILLTYGYWNMGRAERTEYYLETEKNVDDYNIILITDTHYGTIQSTEILKGKISEINAQSPDVVILGGDLVEEGTSKEKMEEVFDVLGKIASKYGIYYVYGNHDRQPYTANRSFTDKELENAITSNGITILEDTYTELPNNLVLVGRGDAAWGNSSDRKSIKEILEEIDIDKYIIVADHQPIEAEENDAQGVDLEVSGHTHAGQIWPVGVFTELFGMLNYGEYQIGDCTVIVSSGFTGWGYPIRTQEHCEYAVIHITH